MLIHHITLVSGNSVAHRLDTLSEAAISTCQTLLPNGGPIPAFPAFRVDIYGPVFTIFRGGEPLVTCGIGSGNSPLWSSLVALQSTYCSVTCNPPKGRWLAVAILPAIINTTQSDLLWLADFERCLAAAVILSD